MTFSIKPFLILGLLYASYSQAECVRTDVPATTITMDMGKIIVNPNLNVGDVIAQGSWPVSDTGDIFKCTAGSVLNAEINTAILTNDNSKIHLTNIPGIGMKIQRVSQSGNTSATYPYSSTRSNNNAVYITPGYFQVTLYKIAAYVGTGALTSGIYSWYSAQGEGVTSSALTSYLNENGTEIISPSCTVISGAQQNVYLASVNYTQLKTVGSTANDTSFSIQLKCSGGAPTNSGYDNVGLTFSGTAPSSLTNNDGVLINEVESTGAKGVGVQILDSTQKSLKLEQKYTVGSLSGSLGGYTIDNHYTARYYRYGSTISPGAVEAKLIFGITYD